MKKTYYAIKNSDTGEFFIGLETSYPSHRSGWSFDLPVKDTYTKDFNKAKLYSSYTGACNASNRLWKDYDNAVESLKHFIERQEKYIDGNRPFYGNRDEVLETIQRADSRIYDIINSRPSAVEVCKLEASFKPI